MTGPSRGSVALVAFLVVGCAAGLPSAPPSDGTATASADAVESPHPALSPSGSPARRYAEVEFGADGGPTLRGRAWSDGRIGIVLAHGFSMVSGQDDWNAFAEYLAGLGYGVPTFDFRAFCDRDGCSEGSLQLGENWRDVEAAVEYLRSRGSERIFIVGASMGGIAAFRAADEAELDIAGIVSLAAPQYPSIYYDGEPAENDVTPERLQRIATPKLFIAGAGNLMWPSTPSGSTLEGFAGHGCNIGRDGVPRPRHRDLNPVGDLRVSERPKFGRSAAVWTNQPVGHAAHSKRTDPHDALYEVPKKKR